MHELSGYFPEVTVLYGFDSFGVHDISVNSCAYKINKAVILSSN